jgi:DNA-binding transcriptional ArsR family regulator
MFRVLDPLLHNQLRLSIMSLLISVESAEFNFLLEKTGATSGNLSIQINKLRDANYIEVIKSFKNNYPLTTCKVTTTGVDAFAKYVDALQEYLKIKK